MGKQEQAHRRVLFVYNPISGKHVIRQRLTEILQVFTAAGYDVLAHPTQAKGDATDVIRRLHAQADLIVCSGGDGTMDEVVSAVMSTDPQKPVGYIPSGSTNDFAHSLGLPKDMIRAAENIVQGDIHRCDIGSFNGDYFVYVAAFGAFTSISYETNQNLKNTLGHVAYLTQAGAQVFNLPNYTITGEIDGKRIAGEYTYGMITNARFVGGIKNITGPGVDMADGIFEMTLIHTPANPIELSEILTTLLSKHAQSPLVEVYKGSHIVLRAKQKIDWTLDGEFGGSHKRVEINNLQEALHLVMKAE